MLQSGWQHLGLHHLKRRVELLQQLGIVDALRIGQLDGQALYTDGFIGKHGVKTKIQEIRADAVAFERCSIQEVHDKAALGGASGTHGLVNEDVLAFGQPGIRRLGQMRHHPSGIVGSALVFIEKQLKQFLLEVAASKSSGIASADSARQYGFEF